MLFAQRRIDALPVLAGLAQLALLVTVFLAFDHIPWWALVVLGCVYAVSISWNINSVQHNFIHHPYFRSRVLNRVFSISQSIALGTPELFIEEVHLRHHRGNSDRRVDGDTVDWLSIYRYSKDDRPENVWSYTFLGIFRNDAGEIVRELAKRDAKKARWAKIQLAVIAVAYIAALIVNWKFVVLFFLPVYYVGHSLSNLNGYYEHFGANPDVPIAWGVSTYGRFYNAVWFNNGYHAEHHYRPNTHWADMPALRERIAAEQAAAGVRVMRRAHALGFTERSPELVS